MKIRLADPETLKPYPHNPRLISQAAIDKVLASVREFGWRQPIVVDEDGVILVGHTRRLAAIKGGYKQVPVHDATGLTEAQKRAYRLADNRTGEEARWDFVGLAAELSALSDLGIDFGPLGFSDVELLNIQFGGGDPTDPNSEWEGMPEFSNPNNCHRKVIVSFKSERDFKKFFAAIGQEPTNDTKSIWYPAQKRRDLKNKRWTDDGK